MNTETASRYMGLIGTLTAKLESREFRDRHRSNTKAFTRERCLTFVLVITFLLNLVKRALQDELDEYFKLLEGEEVAERVVTKSAFSQARQKLKYEAFIELNQTQVMYFYDQFDPETWYGLRLLAIDGSMSELPNTAEIREHFGVWQPAAGGVCPKARISQMYDVLNQVNVDAIIAPKALGERVLAAQHFEHLQRDDLVLLDSGYHAFWQFALIRAQAAHFCARMPLIGWKAVERFVASGLKEQSVTLQPSYESAKQCQARQLSTDPLTVRLVRIELDNGEIEVLATSLLSTQDYPYALFKDLYHHRWPVEESYKVMKCRIEIENFTGKSVQAVYQDFHAKVFTMNFTAILAQPAQKVVQENSQDKQYTYQINMTNAFSKMKDTLVLLFQRPTISRLLDRFWQLITRTLEPVRPGRSYPRNKRVKRPRFPMAYKPIR